LEITFSSSPLERFLLWVKKIACHDFHACDHCDYNDEGSISSPASDDVMLFYASIGTRLLQKLWHGT